MFAWQTSAFSCLDVPCLPICGSEKVKHLVKFDNAINSVQELNIILEGDQSGFTHSLFWILYGPASATYTYFQKWLRKKYA